jgi:UDPglucose--hexose-1-phosphate uridylyltransferase
VPKAALEELHRRETCITKPPGAAATAKSSSVKAKGSERIVFEHEHFVALCPFAPRFSYETWILPKAHSADFAASAEREISDFARALHETITRLDRRARRSAV